MGWYLKTLDGKLVYADGQTPPAFFVKLPGGMVLEIYQSHRTLPETADNKLSGWRHVALRVDSIVSAKVQLESRGVKFGAKTAPAVGGGNVLYFADAEGNLLHLVERTPESPLR